MNTANLFSRMAIAALVGAGVASCLPNQGSDGVVAPGPAGGGGQGGVNIQICNRSGSTGDCNQSATNTNTGQTKVREGDLSPGLDAGGEITGDPDLEEKFRLLSGSFHAVPDSLKTIPPDPEFDAEAAKSFDRQMEEKLPEWDDTIVSQPDGPPGAESATTGQIAGLYADNPDDMSWQAQPDGSERAVTAKARYSRDLANGRVTAISATINDDVATNFFSREPIFYWNSKIDTRAKCIANLNTHDTEFGNTDRSLFLMKGMDFAKAEYEERFGGTIVTVARALNGVKIQNSQCRMIFHPNQRLMFATVTWPKFTMAGTWTSARGRGAVLEQIRSELLARSVFHEGSTVFNASLRYVRADKMFPPLGPEQGVTNPAGVVPAVRIDVIRSTGDGSESGVSTITHFVSVHSPVP